MKDKLGALLVLALEIRQFNATPAVADNQIFLRSDGYLYCLTSGS